HSDIIQVAFSAVDDLAGVGSVVATIDGHPVTTGQAIDLFYATLGTHTLVVVATDRAGNLATATVTFNVIATISSLKDVLGKCYALGWIDSSGVKNSLMAKLNAAEARISAGTTTAAKNMLNAFINEVRAQTGKHISQRAAELLIADAQYVIDHI
ncbi:hypothetical protein FJY63_07510, partial [Candidatus Sumerlaeota bacterium]|nr:hypothetical protein [Candidatus Sumerlaeota bacterium]